jgi:hypothetical protein
MSHSRGNLDNGQTTAYYQGVEAERERIITLLQADICPDWATQIPYCCDGACSAYSDAIALIKGEQK